MTPAVRLLDARRAGLDREGLRAWARAQRLPAGAACVARSYRHPFALVAWHDAAVGVDIERVEAHDAAFEAVVCTPAERGAGLELSSLWCAKEALAKALGDALRYEPARLESPSRWPDGASGPWRARACAAPAGHVAWVVWRDEPPGFA